MLSQDKIYKIKELHKLGLTNKKIAEEVGCCASTVKKYINNEIKDKMIGKKFGKLTVLEKAPKNPNLKSRCIRYICKCECGNIIEVNGNSLRTGHTTSCGCSRKNVNIKNLLGQRFGYLTVIEITNKRRDNHVIWKCKCDCGKIVEVCRKELLNGHTRSCGCLKSSYGEQLIAKLLKELNLDFITEYKFTDCKYKDKLRFDFAIIKNKKIICLIEFQGVQHYQVTGGWNNIEHLKQVQKRDNIKREYCYNNNIPLIEIPFYDIDKIDINYMKGLLNDWL